MKRPPRPAPVYRGGTGGVLPRPPRHHADNAREVLTGADIRDPEARRAFEAQLLETVDPDDVAHAFRRMPEGCAGVPEAEVLIPARELRPEQRAKARPRRVHPSQAVWTPAGPVSIDTAADAHGLRQLAAAELGAETRRPPDAVFALIARLGPEGARSVLRQRTRTADRDQEHEARVRAFLRSHARR